MLESSGENLMTSIKIQAADARYATLWNIARSTASTQFYPAESSDYTNLPQELTDYGNSKGVNIAQTVYQGENNTNQLGTDVTSVTAIGAAFVSGAFDEPLAEPEVRKILDLFEE